MKFLDHGNVTILENHPFTLASFPDGNIDHRSGRVVSPNTWFGNRYLPSDRIGTG
jgi:hypothetical protein